MTAVTLTRQLLLKEHTVLGVLAGCVISGSGAAFACPISVFRSKQDCCWSRDDGLLFSIWRQSGYNVDLEAHCGAQHAWVVDRTCIHLCLQWFENLHGVQNLE